MVIKKKKEEEAEIVPVVEKMGDGGQEGWLPLHCEKWEVIPLPLFD